MSEPLREALAPTGVLRAGINMGNMLLVTGESPAGEPDGVAPNLVAHIAAKLGVDVEYVPYSSPGALTDAAANDDWDVGLVGDVPARAKLIDFTPAYVEIEATYLVREDSPIESQADVDREGVRIAISGRSAYDLYLSDHLLQAELVRAKGIAAASDLFFAQRLDALAGLRPALMADVESHPGHRILDGRFTTVQQAVGTPKGRDPSALAFLKGVVADATSGGMIQDLINQHGVTGKLSVASESTESGKG